MSAAVHSSAAADTSRPQPELLTSSTGVDSPEAVQYQAASLAPAEPSPSPASTGSAEGGAPVPPPPAAPAAASLASPGSASAGSPPSIVTEPSRTVRREMLDIEANVSLQVGNVERSVRALHRIAQRLGGVITAEQVDSASQYGSAQLTLRVPSAVAPNLFDQLGGLGKVLNQRVTTRDIGKEFFDAQLRVSTLETTLRRYQEILTQASKVEEILRIEQELARLRAEIEQVKGNLRWLSDRAARATVHVALHEHVAEVVHAPEPRAKFYPGLRAPVIFDLGASDRPVLLGGGISVRFGRGFSVDLDLGKRLGADPTPRSGPDVLIATLGGELYSELLGGGKRRFLNPYLGVRGGYARFHQNDQLMVGATIGAELYKSRGFILDLETRHSLAFGGDRGLHYVFAPALAGSFAF